MAMQQFQEKINESNIDPETSPFKKTLTQYFPGSRLSNDFVEYSLRTLRPFGFQPHNTMACVSVCRDELTRPFINNLHEIWERLFNFSSLAGMLFLGITGFKAAHQHAPNTDGVERYVYFAFPHIAIDENGIVGNCRRPGRHEMSHACGALLNVLQDLAQGSVGLELNQDDLEQSLLKQRLFRKLRYGGITDLVTLTKVAHSVIREDLERMIKLTTESASFPYAVFTGIQLHGPGNQTWIWTDSSSSYVVIDGAHEILLDEFSPILGRKA